MPTTLLSLAPWRQELIHPIRSGANKKRRFSRRRWQKEFDRFNWPPQSKLRSFTDETPANENAVERLRQHHRLLTSAMEEAMFIFEVLWQQIHVMPESYPEELPDLHRAVADQIRVCGVLGLHRALTVRALQEALIASGQVEEWRK